MSTRRELETQIIAPRSPETDKVFDCLNETNNGADLANNIAISTLAQARSKYD